MSERSNTIVSDKGTESAESAILALGGSVDGGWIDPDELDLVLIRLAEEEEEGPDAQLDDATLDRMVGDPIFAYLRNIGRVALLDAAQEVDLAKQIEAGQFAETVLELRVGGGSDMLDGMVKAQTQYWLDKTPEEKLPPKGSTKAQREAIMKELRVKAGVLAVQSASHDMARLERMAEDRRCYPSLELDRLAEEGRRAKDHMIEANLRLVVSLAKKRTNEHMPLLDAVQNGSFGLIRAVEKFDYTRGYKFSTYATWWINQAIGREYADQAGAIRLPVHMREKLSHRDKAIKKLSEALPPGKEPSDVAIAKELGMTIDVYNLMMGAVRRMIPLDAPIEARNGKSGNGDGTMSFADVLEDADALPQDRMAMHHALRGALERALDEILTEREKGVAMMRMGMSHGDGQPKTLDEVGAAYGVTRERIRQIEAKIYTKMRNQAGYLKSYLDESWLP